VTDFAEGGDLFEVIKTCTKEKTLLPEQAIWRYLYQISQGLKYLHDINIIHRDIKGANILLNKDRSIAMLGDMNVSKVAKGQFLFTQTGTPYYASPEVWRDEPYDYKSDIWSLGCLIYELCALLPPFRGKDMQALFNRVQTYE
jgi:NIMA (never in mitosis gene a)-related kinase 1/4/5